MRSTVSTFNEVWQCQFRQSVLAQIATIPSHSQLFLACSGGLDSLLLLYLLSDICPKRLQVIYIDHQLQKESKNWAKHIANSCEQLHVKFCSVSVDVAKGNLEQQARIARYNVFKALLKPYDVLILAHHQQDQAETMLLRLFSGTGVRGLSAMRLFEQREDYAIWRPFLNYSRQQLTQWATQINLQFVQDPMNDELTYDRVWSRKVLWPIIEQRFPKMQKALSRTSQIMQDSYDILQEVAIQDWNTCGDEQKLDIRQLQRLSIARQRQVLSLFMQGQQIYAPQFEMVERLQTEVILARHDAQSHLYFNQHHYVRYAHYLYRYHQQQWETFFQINDEFQVILNIGMKLDLSTQCFRVSPTTDIGLSDQLLGRKLYLKNRVGGEKMRVYGRGTKSIKKLLQEYQIEPWLRLNTKLLYYNDILLGILTFKQFILADSQYTQMNGWQIIIDGEQNES